jgi:multiple sugar transport system substrate-binding protein
VFKVISYLVSDEVQLALARTAQMSPRAEVKFQDEFGKNYPSLKSKNLKGIFKGHPASLPTATIYDAEGLKAARSAWQDVLVNKTDINTALRTGNEKLQKAIETINKR